jgi:hypothetical protein
MELAAAQQPSRNVGRLKHCPLGWQVGRKVARDGDQDMTPLSGVAPFAELPHASLQHLVGVKARILAEQPLRERCDQRVRRMAKREMARDQAAGLIDLTLAIERVQQSRADVLHRVGKVVEPVADLAREPRRRNVEVAGEVDRHRPVEHPARRVDPTVVPALL